MRHNLIKGAHMRGHGIVALGTMMCRVADKVAVHGHHIQMAIDVVRHLEAIAECRRLVTALRHYSKHRNRYKTLGDYYPEIAKCLEEYLKVETERIDNAL